MHHNVLGQPEAMWCNLLGSGCGGRFCQRAVTLSGRKVAELSARDFSFGIDRYRLSFAEEFDGFSRWDGRGAPDGGTWRTRMAFGDGTEMSPNESQAFVDRNFNGLGLDPFSLEDGALKITGTWRPDLKNQLNGKEFASGVVTTHASFAQTYGYFEARIKVPDWQGGFPAFWMLPTDGSWPPEIDIIASWSSSAGNPIASSRWATRRGSTPRSTIPTAWNGRPSGSPGSSTASSPSRRRTPASTSRCTSC
jgi:beta-glucanase (GH16 family)